MAERRMFSKSIVLTDAFLDMPLSTRCLYFTLGMLADDDGFVGSPKSVMRQCGATEDDLKVLLTKRYVLGFESGVIVIKHWRMNNYLQNDRHHPTTYLEELGELSIDERGAYTDHKNKCIQNVSKTYTEISIDKNNKDNNIYAYGEYSNVKLTDEQMIKLQEEFPNDWKQRIEKVDLYCQSTGKKYKDYLATIRNWARKNEQKIEKPNYEAENEQEFDDKEFEELMRKRNER